MNKSFQWLTKSTQLNSTLRVYPKIYSKSFSNFSFLLKNDLESLKKRIENLEEETKCLRKYNLYLKEIFDDNKMKTNNEKRSEIMNNPNPTPDYGRPMRA